MSVQSIEPTQIEVTPLHVHLPSAATADVCDANPSAKVLQAWFTAYGGAPRCAGPIVTIATRDDNSLVKSVVAEAGAGRILVIDNKASTSCAMLGGRLAQLAADNGWAGIVVNGAVRDLEELQATPIAIFALASCPRRSINRGIGERDIQVRMGGECISHKDFLVADADGVVVLPSWIAQGGIE